MKRRRLILIVISLAVMTVFILAFLPDGQPGYQGRTLTAWIDDLQESGPGTPQWLTASNAVYNIGTNAVPILMRWVMSSDSKAKAAIISIWNAHANYEWRIRSREERQMMAWFGFGVLGEKSSSAWPVFVQWTEDKDKDTRKHGIAMLRGCRADKAVFLPVARRLLKDPDPVVQVMTAAYLNDLYPDEAEAREAYRQFPISPPLPANTVSTNQPALK
jgi:hypothetical protein